MNTDKFTPIYDERIQTDAWKREVARELNVLLARADYYDGAIDPSNLDLHVANAIRSIVRRVAEFEDIAYLAQARGTPEARSAQRKPSAKARKGKAQR